MTWPRPGATSDLPSRPAASTELFVAAAEPSGDRLGAELVVELRRRGLALDARGLAGPWMREAGVEAVARSEDATALGLVEVVSGLPRIAGVLRRLKRDLQGRPPSVVLTIDSPGLMSRLGAAARRGGHRVIHWVAPQVWAWRPGRVRRLSRSFDRVLCLLPQEPELLGPHVPAVFTGHPAAAIRPGDRVRPGQPTFALVPGSRPSEIARHWPVLREVARRLRARHPTAGFVVPRAPSVPLSALGGLDAVIVERMADVAAADAAVVASGTATVELAALGVPMVVVYRLHPLTYALVRHLVRVRHVALPNLVADAPTIPEFVQTLHPDTIADAVDRVRDTEQVSPQLLAALAGDGAVRRAADEVEAALQVFER